MGKKRSLWKKSEEPETPPVEVQEEKKTSKDYYTRQKERFLADERLSGMDSEQKKRALGKFFNTYGVPYAQGSGISDKDQLDRFRERFVDENIANISEPKAKKKDEETSEYQKWLDAAPSFEDISQKDEVTPPFKSVEAEESSRRAMGLATGIPAIIKAPPLDTSIEATEAIAKDLRIITPQGANDTNVTSIVKQNVEKVYVDKGWPSPMGKIKQFYERSAEFQREVQTGKMDQKQYNQNIDELAGEIGIGRKENGDLFVYENEMAMYKDELEKGYRKYLDETGAKEKDGFVKDFFQALSIGSEDVLNTGTRILATSEGLSNSLLKLLNSDREGPAYWKDKAALEAEIVDKHRVDNKRYDESITELLAQGKNGKAAAQTALSAAEALPRLSILAMGNAAGATNITLGWMGGDKAIQEYMRTEKDPNMTKLTRFWNALGKGISEPMFESMGTVKLLNAGRRAIKEMGEDVVRKEMIKAYTPFLQRQMAIWDKGVSAMMREAGEEGATSLTDDMMDIMSGIKTFDQFGETVLDEMIVGGVIGFGLGSPQMIAESGGKSKYVKNIVKTIPEDFDIESKLAMASMIVKYDQQRWLMNEAPEAMKEVYKKQMAHTQNLINDMMDRGTFEPTKMAPDIQTFAEKLRDDKLPVEKEVKEEPVKQEGDQQVTWFEEKEKAQYKSENIEVEVAQKFNEEGWDVDVSLKADTDTGYLKHKGLSKHFDTKEEGIEWANKTIKKVEKPGMAQKEGAKPPVEKRPTKEPKPEKQPEITPEKPHTFDTQFMDDAALVERIEVADKTIAALDKMEKAGETGEVKDKEAHLDTGNTTQLFGPGRNKVESPEDIARLKQEALEAKQAAQESIERRKGVEPTKGKIKYGEREFDSIDELAEELAKYPIERLPLPEMDIDVFRAMEKALEIQKERKPAEEPVPKEIAEEKPPKELTQEQESHNALLEQVRSLNQIPKTHTAKRSKKMAGITRMATKLGYGLKEEKGKVIALNVKGKRIKTISAPAEYISMKDVKNEKASKFIGEFLEQRENITDLGIQMYGKKLLKAREDVLAGKKNQNSDILIRELQRMHEEGYIEIRTVDEVKKIPVEEIESMMTDQKLEDFVNEHGVLDVTNIDKALEAGLIKKEDYERTKQQLEEDIRQRVKAELGVEEEIYGAEDIKGKEVEKPKLSEDMRTLAENIRKGKLETKGVAMGTLPGFPQAWNFSIEVVATTIEGGAALVDAVNTGIAKLKEQEFFKKLNTEDQKKMEEDVRARLKEITGMEEKETEAAAMSIEDENVVMDKPTSKVAPKKKAVEKPVEGKTDEDISRDKLGERVDTRRKEINRINALKQGKARRVLDEHFVDVNEPFKKAIIKEGGEGAKKFVNRMNLEAGAPARAKALIQEAQQKIFGKGVKTMSKNQQELLSEVVDLVRIKELDDLYEKRGQKLLEHEGGITGKDAEVFLEDFRNKAPWILEKFKVKDYDPDAIIKSIDAYHNVMRDQLTKLYENGIIGEAAYNKLKDEQPYYSPRRYIQHMDEIDPNGKMSGIKALQGGSVGEKVVDLNTLMSDAIARTEGLVAKNIKMQSAAAYATETESAIIRKAPFTKEFKEKLKQRDEMQEQGELFEGMGEMQIYLEPEFEETPKGMTAVDYFEDGNRHRVWIDTDLYDYFDYAPADERTEMALHGLSMMLGTPILKFFATGANPEFAIKNLPIDALHVWMTTPEYSWFMPLAMKQMSADYAKIAKEAWTKTGRYKDYINEGGGMDFLATQGTEILSRYKRYTKWTSSVGQMRDGMAKIGEFSETLTRLAIRERYINNRLAKAKKEGRELSDKEMKSLQEDGTAFARNYLDFSQGGKTAKLLDKFIPYFNAGVQVTRGSLRAVGKNPKLFAAKLSQITGLALTLTAWNMGDIGDDEEAEGRRKAYLNDVNDQVKARNFILMTNMKYMDNAGRERYLYFKIPKDALQSNITSLMEDIYIKATHDGAYKLMDDKMFAALNNEFRNITDLGNLPPLIQGAQGFKRNYDPFYETEIWTGREQPEKDASAEYYQGVTPPRFVKFGHMTGMSPVRSQYFAKQFFTEGNLYGAMMGEFFDGLAIGFKGEAEEVIQKEGYEKLKNTPGIRRVLKSSYPKESEVAAEAELELNKVKTENDQRFNQLVGKKSVRDIDDDAVHQFLTDVYERDGLYEVDRMRDKFEIRAKTEGVSPAIIKLKWWSPESRALGFYEMLKNNPQQSTELWKQAGDAGLRSERFNQEVGRLITMDKESEPEK